MEAQEHWPVTVEAETGPMQVQAKDTRGKQSCSLQNCENTFLLGKLFSMWDLLLQP